MPLKNDEKRMIILAFLSLMLTILIVIFSEDAFYASLEGLRIWWEIVFPSLLPFFIIAEIMMGLGVVHFLGALLEPLMRPLFKVPGVGAFAMAMGLASGYPIGAKITASLRRKNLCSQVEAERLIAFTNTADPLFLVGAVAVGMFHSAELGLIIAAAHYISSLLTGLIMRFYRGREINQITTQRRINNTGVFSNALRELINARRNDGRSLGELLGDSVRESINTLLMVGGFIILFSVITRMIIITGLIEFITTAALYVLHPLGFSGEVVLPLISGFFEITNGTNLASQARAPLLQQLTVAGVIIAWSGLSVHAQVAAMIEGTDIRMKPYFIARIIQGILAGISTFLIFSFYQSRTVPAFLPYIPQVTRLRDFLLLSIIYLLMIIIVMTVFSILIYVFRRIKIII